MCVKRKKLARDYLKREDDNINFPVNWKSCLNILEVANPAVESSVELPLMAGDDKLMKFPYEKKISRDTNVCIWYTSATCDMNFSKTRMNNVKILKGPSGVFHTKSKTRKYNWLRSLLLTSVMKMETLNFDSKWTRYTPGSQFNLFGIGSQLSKGWNIEGNDETIWIEKYGSKVKFDENITTQKRVI